ncbi:MAG: hypothetical protein Q8P68_03580 [Candidatus Peregrinibacteria bacterium]|nr:hypothetical protein [Candidatus Peregrinibacteria bacterium]
MLKYLYLVGALITTVIIFVIAFENIQALCVDMVIFFTPVSSSTTPTILIFWVSAFGILCGFFYHGLIHSMFEKKDDDEEDDY